jgi:hypothetical protein
MLKGRTPDQEPAGYHGVHFYRTSAELSEAVVDFLGRGVAAREPVLIIATASHRRRFTTSLLKQQRTIEDSIGGGSVTLLDAETTLQRFMVNGLPDASRFRAAMAPVLHRAAKRRRNQTIRAYGEMVDVLWQQGRFDAAVQLELLWNELATTHRFSLLCGYAGGHCGTTTSREMLRSLHTCEHA